MSPIRIVGRHFQSADQRLAKRKGDIHPAIESTAAQILREALDCFRGTVPKEHYGPVHVRASSFAALGTSNAVQFIRLVQADVCRKQFDRVGGH